MHAGVIGWKGRAVLIPGLSFAVKSTLVAEFLRRGASYYSDEFAVLQPTGLIEPYARRLSLRQSEGRPLRPASDSLGGTKPAGPAQPAFVVFAPYRAGASWQPRRLPSGLAVLELMKHCLSVRRRPEAALDTLSSLAQRTCVLHGPRGEAAATVDILLREFQRHDDSHTDVDSTPLS